MKRSPYGERDYAFGQLMLTLRMGIGLTQVGLAERLGVSRHTVGEWEGGLTYPKADHLKAFVALGVRASVFAAGREEEEIRALWHAAHQKVLLDGRWLQGLLGTRRHRLVLVAPELDGQTNADEQGVAQLAVGPRVDWGDALNVPSFYGREQELATLAQWVLQERCRAVSVLGMGGIGKSALVTSAMRQWAAHFQVVLFRSLRDAPSCEALVEDCLQVLAPQPLDLAAADLERRLGLLLAYLREQRVLLVLDNLEVLLLEGEAMGQLRPGYEGYARLLRRVAETAHQSCLLLTSREKPAALRALEGRKTPMRSLRLVGLEAAACEQLLAEHELVGSPEERARLGERYAGNPLALKIVAETIADLFGGEIGQFLAQDMLVFGSIIDLLDEQIGRLSALEQTILYWLAIAREPVTLEELRALLVARLSPAQVLEAADGLRRRSLIERGQRPGSFTLHSVVLEYVTAHLVEQVASEIAQGRLSLLTQHRLCQAQAKEYVRQTQERLILAPLLASLQSVGHSRADVEKQLCDLLDQVRPWDEGAQGYGPANLVALLRLLRGDLRGLNLSQLSLRGVYLQGVEMQEATLAGAMIENSVWTSTFDASWAVAISNTGQYWAAGSKRVEVQVWEWEKEAGQTLHRIWQAHADIVSTIAFSPDGRRLASGSYDGSIKLWEVASGTLLWTAWHTDSIYSVAFAPDGSLLASGGNDATVQLWDPQGGTHLETLPHPDPVYTIAWSPDGRLLASGGLTGQIRLWMIQKTGPSTCMQTLVGHTNWVWGLAFAPDGSLLASGSWDRTVQLWEVASGSVRQTLAGHTDRVQTVAWSPDGRTVASAGFDHTTWLWDVESSSYRAVLHGHTGVVYALAFTPDSRRLLSGSGDGTLRVEDVASGQCVQILQGYAVSLYDVAWSPDGTKLASAGSYSLVTIWDAEGLTPPRLLCGHRHLVYGVEWSPDGSLLASSGWDSTIRVWDAATREGRQLMRDPDDPYTSFYGVVWSLDGHRLASGSYRQGVQMWEVSTGSRSWVARGQPTRAHRVAWSPDGTKLASGGDDGSVYLWDASDGTRLLRLPGHQGRVNDVTWSRDGTRLASGGGSQGQGDGGELFVWDTRSGERVRALAGHPGMVYAVAWSPTGAVLVSGGSDGVLRWWEVQSGECVRMHKGHQGTIRRLQVSPDGGRLASCGDDGAITLWNLERGEHLRTLRRDRPYERLDITGIRGLSDTQKASLRALGAFEETSSGG